MEFYEELVFQYASTSLSERLGSPLLIHPQFHISKDKQGNDWGADIDFLFVDLKHYTVYLVEVSSISNKPYRIKQKLEPEYRDTVENFVLHYFLPQLCNVKWKISWQIYVRNRHIEWLQKSVGNVNIEYLSLDKDILSSLINKLQ